MKRGGDVCASRGIPGRAACSVWPVLGLPAGICRAEDTASKAHHRGTDSNQLVTVQHSRSLGDACAQGLLTGILLQHLIHFIESWGQCTREDGVKNEGLTRKKKNL